MNQVATQAQAGELRSKAVTVLQPAHDRVAWAAERFRPPTRRGPVFETTPDE